MDESVALLLTQTGEFNLLVIFEKKNCFSSFSSTIRCGEKVMARMHSRAKGVSGSTKPIKKVVPGWLKYTPKEAELLVVKYAKENKKPSQIGILLRDQYGIPDIKLITGKSVNDIFKSKNIKQELPEDFLALIKKSVLLRKHLETNKKDMSAKRGLQLTDSKIRRLAKYYKTKGVLDAKWRYNPDQFKMYAQE